jgi:hypothetical protein
MTRSKHGLRPTHPNRFYHLGAGGEYRYATARRRCFLKRCAARLERRQARADLTYLAN